MPDPNNPITGPLTDEVKASMEEKFTDISSSKSLDDLNSKLDRLVEAVEADKKSIPTLNVKDLQVLASRYLTGEAKRLMENKAKTISVETDNGDCYKAIFFSVQVSDSNLEEAVKELANIANSLEHDGLIHSVLAPISSIELLKIAGRVKTSAVFFFPLVPESSVELIKAKYKYITEEGSAGEAIGSLMPVLEPGEFLAEVRLSVHLFHDKINYLAQMVNTVNDYLKFLPEGTRVVNIEECAIHALSVSYEVKFFNPLLPLVKKVELNSIRQVVRVDKCLKQFDLFTGLSYYDADDKKLFDYK